MKPLLVTNNEAVVKPIYMICAGNILFQTRKYLKRTLQNLERLLPPHYNEITLLVADGDLVSTTLACKTRSCSELKRDYPSWLKMLTEKVENANLEKGKNI